MSTLKNKIPHGFRVVEKKASEIVVGDRIRLFTDGTSGYMVTEIGKVDADTVGIVLGEGGDLGFLEYEDCNNTHVEVEVPLGGN